jgi:hypothetical protein
VSYGKSSASKRELTANTERLNPVVTQIITASVVDY